MHLGTGRFWRSCGVFVLLVALVVALAGCADGDSEQGVDEGSGSESAAPEAEKATSPEGYLPPEVVEADCDGCTEVTQDPLTLNDEAKYQFAYDGHGGVRYLIMTGVEAAQYEELLAASEEAQATAGELKQLEGVGDGAFVQGTQGIMVKGEDTVLLWANTLQDASGEEFQAITTDELEQLLREIDARM